MLILVQDDSLSLETVKNILIYACIAQTRIFQLKKSTNNTLKL